jgi:pilus assembly protein FimV
MSRSLDPLFLTMAISLPGASQALGLGDIHVVSELNQPLSARIDILGANAEQLVGLNAAIASREIFASYGADRPAFLSSTYFKVGLDGRGHPVLEVHSTEAFTEPLVSLFVEVRWGTGNLVREYTLLLDPAGFPTPVGNDTMVAAAVTSDASPQGASTKATRATAAPAADADAPRRITVARRDTLGSIARRAMRARGELRRTMIAIYRANPEAFAGNINRLRRGATLIMPAREAIASISKAEANREFQTQMAAWRSAGGGVPAANPSLQSTGTAAVAAATPATPAASTASTASTAAKPIAAAAATDDPSELQSRIASLEQALDETNRTLAAKHAEVLDMQQQIALAETKAAATAAAPAPVVGPAPAAGTASAAGTAVAAASAAAPAHPTMTLQPPVQAAPQAKPAAKSPVAAHVPTTAGGAASALVAAVAASLVALLGAGFAVLRLRMRRGASKAAGGWKSTRIYRHGDRDEKDDMPLPGDDVLNDSQAGDMLGIGNEIAPLAASQASQATARPGSAPPPTHATAHTERRTGQPERREYTPLEAETVETHVLMPSGLNDAAVFTERRSNPIDVLRQAIAREPERRDLRLKLLELYHAAAASNRQAFLEAARELAHDPVHAQADEWTKVTTMGRHLALDDALLSVESGHEGGIEPAERPGTGGALADCA